MPNGLTSDGRTTESGLLVSPISANSRYVGIASAVVGTITEPSTTQNNRFLPLNSNFANPYPAAAQISAAPTALMNEYASVLRSHVQKTPSSLLNVSLMLSNRLKSANQSPKESNRSLIDFVDAISSQPSGIRKYTRKARSEERRVGKECRSR